MIAQWRLFLLALRYFTRIPVPVRTQEKPGEVLWVSAARFLPAVGACVGLIAGGVYWLAARVWPTSIAVMLSLLAVVLATGGPRLTELGVTGFIFTLLIKYNALMALSAANLGFALPENLPLGVILIAAHAASRALVVSVIATTRSAVSPPSTGELSFALLTGFAPATVLGTPGLFGLAAAIIMRMTVAAYIKHVWVRNPGDYLGETQQFAEVGFYLGALAAWTYT
jgi:adenosylcobinamide-GDP ribazoletransferase